MGATNDSTKPQPLQSPLVPAGEGQGSNLTDETYKSYRHQPGHTTGEPEKIIFEFYNPKPTTGLVKVNQVACALPCFHDSPGHRCTRRS